MDVVLGVSVADPAAPSTVRMVLMEGETADGVTVDQNAFDAGAVGDSLPERLVAAIVDARESARQGGYQLNSTGVTVADQVEAAQLRAVLADRRVENVMLVSAFLAAAALAQAVGNLTRYQRTGLLFIQPDTATSRRPFRRSSRSCRSRYRVCRAARRSNGRSRRGTAVTGVAEMDATTVTAVDPAPIFRSRSPSPACIWGESDQPKRNKMA